MSQQLEFEHLHPQTTLREQVLQRLSFEEFQNLIGRDGGKGMNNIGNIGNVGSRNVRDTRNSIGNRSAKSTAITTAYTAETDLSPFTNLVSIKIPRTDGGVKNRMVEMFIYFLENVMMPKNLPAFIENLEAKEKLRKKKSLKKKSPAKQVKVKDLPEKAVETGVVVI